jgi:DNA polymerase III subunit chi
MTEVSFHFNAPEKLGYACRVLRKGFQLGSRMVVLVEPAALGALDLALWQKSTHDFLPHCSDGDPPHVQAHSPVLLCSGAPQASGNGRVLVNLRAAMPEDFAAYAKVIEIVTFDTHDRDQARDRWRRYRQAGIEPQRHDLNLVPQA